MSISKNKWSEIFFFKGAIFSYVTMTVCLLLTSWLGYLVPNKLLEFPRKYQDYQGYINLIMEFLVIYIGIYLVRVGYQLSINDYIKNLSNHVRNKVYKTWLLHYEAKTEEKLRDQYPLGEVIARIMSDTQALRELVTSGAFGILIDIFFVFSFLFSFISINKFSGIFLGFSELVVTLLLIWGGKFMRDVFHSVRTSKGIVSQTMSNLVGGLDQIYFTPSHDYGIKKGTASCNDFLEKQISSNNWDAAYYSLAESIYPLFLALIVFIFPYSKITEGAIILALVELIQRSIGPIKSVAGKITNIQRALTGFSRIMEFTSDLGAVQNEARENKFHQISLSSLKVDIDEFYYSRDKDRKQFSLMDIHFEANKGEVIGIVGFSGSGKSTLLNIISANLIPQKGKLSVFISDKEEYVSFPGDITQINKYREQVGIVSQESHIFSESLFFNITLQREMPKDFPAFWEWVKENIHYLKKWNLEPEDEINSSILSPGQKQLLSSIRACYLKKTIVLLDEISSALDSDLELALREIILLIQRQSLVMIVAHRIETVINADKILVIDNGRLVGLGNHDHLMKTFPPYKKFIEELSS
ncbi:MAG: ATP-binding cassette domain-containing protein [Bacteriovoracales bacterium]